MIDRKRLREGRLKISSELAKTKQRVDQVVEAEVEIVENYRKRGRIRHFEILDHWSIFYSAPSFDCTAK